MTLIDDLDASSAFADSELRRKRQLALLRQPNDYGEALLDITEELDEADRVA